LQGWARQDSIDAGIGSYSGALEIFSEHKSKHAAAPCLNANISWIDNERLPSAAKTQRFYRCFPTNSSKGVIIEGCQPGISDRATSAGDACCQHGIAPFSRL
jgi:hypothetical protein